MIDELGIFEKIILGIVIFVTVFGIIGGFIHWIELLFKK